MHTQTHTEICHKNTNSETITYKQRPISLKKKKTSQGNMRQKKSIKHHWVPLVLAVYCWAWGLFSSVAYIPSETLLDFPLEQLLIGDSVLVRDVRPLLLSAGTWFRAVQALCTMSSLCEFLCRSSLCEFLCRSCCVWKALFPRCPPSSLALTLSTSSLSPKGRSLMEPTS